MDNYNQLNEEENLKAENEFLKMKLMLEQGAAFGGSTDMELPAGIENQFLKNIIGFEKQFEKHKTIKVFDKIGRPSHFKPVAEIPDDQTEQAWNELSVYLSGFGIDVSACSPNISSRELYRFITEELFDHEIDDMNIPGMMTGFIYDEFHPDPVYDNSRMVEQNLFRDIFSKSDLFYEIHYDKDGFVFNNRLYENREPFIEMINRFKSLFDKIRVINCTITTCEVKEKDCIVAGNYKATAKTGNEKMDYSGDFMVELIFNEMEYWYFKKIQINGFNP